ncbi:unnamed protein product [Rotaria magnacalcarata]|uniref:Uncharacterized protein n=2 Tax=Rotaria magnacalcarata TaxID=392030 RepID=A0A815XAI1_9BILA|nr:unnamed protein product [Rotaria magnacalcarata]
MEFNPEGLGQFIHRLVVRHTTDIQESDVEVTDDNSSSSSSSSSSSANATEPNTKRYCLMIFNDPELSQDLKRKTRRKQETVNRQQQTSPVTSQTVATTAQQDDDDDEDEDDEDEDEEQVLAFNLRISGKLEKLVNKFMKHQRRIPNGRYYLDLTKPK